MDRLMRFSLITLSAFTLVGCIDNSSSSDSSDEEDETSLAEEVQVLSQTGCPVEGVRALQYDSEGALLSDQMSNENGWVDLSDIPKDGYVGLLSEGSSVADGDQFIMSTVPRSAVLEGDEWIFRSAEDEKPCDSESESQISEAEYFEIRVTNAEDFESLIVGPPSNLVPPESNEEVISVEADYVAVLGVDDERPQGDEPQVYGFSGDLSSDTSPAEIHVNQPMRQLTWSSDHPVANHVELEWYQDTRRASTEWVSFQGDDEGIADGTPVQSGSMGVIREGGTLSIRVDAGDGEPFVYQNFHVDDSVDHVDLPTRDPEDLSNVSVSGDRVQYDLANDDDLERVSARRFTEDADECAGRFTQRHVSDQVDEELVFPEKPEPFDECVRFDSDFEWLRLSNFPLTRDADVLSGVFISGDDRTQRISLEKDWIEFQYYSGGF